MSVCTSETYFSVLGHWYHLKKSLGNKFWSTGELPNAPPPGYANGSMMSNLFLSFQGYFHRPIKWLSFFNLFNSFSVYARMLRPSGRMSTVTPTNRIFPFLCNNPRFRGQLLLDLTRFSSSVSGGFHRLIEGQSLYGVPFPLSVPQFLFNLSESFSFYCSSFHTTMWRPVVSWSKRVSRFLF